MFLEWPEDFILKELRDFAERHKNTPTHMRPHLSFGSVQMKFFKDAIIGLEVKKLITITYGQCQECKHRCGHVVITLSTA